MEKFLITNSLKLFVRIHFNRIQIEVSFTNSNQKTISSFLCVNSNYKHFWVYFYSKYSSYIVSKKLKTEQYALGDINVLKTMHTHVFI